MITEILLWSLGIIIFIRIWVKLTSRRVASNVCLVGKTVLITGGNAGLGLKTAVALAGRGCRLIIASRNNTEEIRQQIIKETHNPNIVTKYLDLGSLKSVRAFAKDINDTEDRLDILVNNAAMPMGSNSTTGDGMVTQMQVNYFGSFLLTHLLIGLIKKSAPSRIIFVNSLLVFLNNLSLNNINDEIHWHSLLISMADMVGYAKAKACQVIASNHFAEHLKGTGVTSNCVHPGMVKTDIYSKYFEQGRIHRLTTLHLNVLIKLCGKSVDDGAAPIIEACLANELQDVTGKLFVEGYQFPAPPITYNKEFAQKIWKDSEKLVKLKPEEILEYKNGIIEY